MSEKSFTDADDVRRVLDDAVDTVPPLDETITLSSNIPSVSTPGAEKFTITLSNEPQHVITPTLSRVGKIIISASNKTPHGSEYLMSVEHLGEKELPSFVVDDQPDCWTMTDDELISLDPHEWEKHLCAHQTFLDSIQPIANMDMSNRFSGLFMSSIVEIMTTLWSYKNTMEERMKRIGLERKFCDMERRLKRA
jgi:hypothetical protein